MTTRIRPAGDLLVELVVRDIRLRYRRSVLGIAWSQVSSLAMLAVLSIVFTRVVPLGIEHYVAFVFVGLLAWTLFQSALVAATGSLLASRELVQRPGFPVVLLPLAAVVTQVVQYALSLPALFVAAVLTTGRLPWTVALLPVLVAVELLVVLAPAYVLAHLQVRYRDIGHLVGVVLLPLFYATPVFYSPERAGGQFDWLYRYNPLARIFGAMRAAVLDGRVHDAGAVVVIAVLGAAAGVVALRFFTAHEHEFAEEL
jgi:lipopolysaccharide transport system permease protein